MGNLRKVIASISLVAILSTFAVTNAAFAKSPFTDVGDKHWFTTEGWDVKAKDAGIFTKTTAMPDASVIRADMAMMVAAAAGLNMTSLEAFPSGVFTDVKSTDYWYKSLQAGRQANVFSEKPKFDATGLTNRAQAAKVIVSAFGLTPATPKTKTLSDVNLSYTGADAWMNNIYTAYCYGLVKAGTFNPGANVTRAEFAKMLVVAKDAPTLKAECTKGTDVPPVKTGGGTASFSVVNDPTYTTLPKAATSVALMSFDVDGGTNGVTLKSFDLHKTGVSSLPTNFQVYVYEDGTRLTSGKSFNSTSDVASFTNLGLTVAAGKTRTFTIKADVGTVTATGSFAVEIKEGAVTTDADSVDGLPLESKTFDLSTTTVGTVTISKNGTVNNPKVGEADAQISKFKIAADTEGASLEQIGLFIGGSINTDEVSNLKLYVTGETDPIATADSVGVKNLATFVFAEPYKIEKGGTKSFYVTADFVPGRSSDSIKTFVDETTDVVAIGDKYGFGMQVTDTLYKGPESSCSSGSQTTCNYSELTGGDITVSSNGPIAQDVAVNAKDIHLMDFSMNSVADVTVKQFEVTLDAVGGSTATGLVNDGTANYTDIKIINTDTGEVLMGPVDVTSFVTASGGSTVIGESTDDAQAFYVYTDEFSMTAGQTLHLALTADVANNASLSGDMITASLYINSSYPLIKDVNNKTVTNSSSLVPSSEITGKAMTVKAASLTMSLASTPAAGATTKVKGSKDVKFVGMTFACGTASDCKVTDLSLTGVVDASAGNDTYVVAGTSSYVGSVKLQDTNGNDLTVYKAVNGTTGLVTYTNLDAAKWTIKAGESLTFYVVGDLSSNAVSGDDVTFALASTDNVTVEDKDGNSITGKTGTPNFGTAVDAAKTAYILTSDGGSLTISVDPTTPKSDIVVAGTQDKAVSKFKFESTDEPFVVKKLALTNRQSAVTSSSNLGDYDNNVVSVKISYTNSAGQVESKTTTLSQGTAEFSGLDMYVGKDDSSVLSVSANLNTISNGATAGELLDLNLAFENFEAVAQGSGETYTAAKLDNDVSASSDLDFGSMTSLDSGYDTNGTTDVSSSGSTQTITIDTGSAYFPVGTLLWVDDDANGSFDASSESLFVTTSAWSTTTPTVKVLNNADAQLANNKNVYYSIAGVGTGSGYLTATKEQVVYESKPEISLNSSSPTGSRSVSSTDRPFIFDVKEAGAKEKVSFRMAQVNPATANTTDFTSNTALDGTFTGIDALTTVSTGGIGNSAFQRETSGGTNAAGITYTFASAADLSGYSGISFWARSSSAANTVTLTVNDSAGTDQTAVANLATADTWEFVDLSFAGVASTNLDVIDTLDWAVTDGSAINAATYDIDEITLYKEKVTVNATSDSDFDTNTAGTADNLAAYLKDGNDTVMTGYWYSSTQSSDASTMSATLYPTTADFEISKGTQKTLALQTDTGSLLAEDAGTDDPVTFDISLGSMSATVGTVTAGGFWWFDTNATVKWLGDVANSSFSSNTIKY